MLFNYYIFWITVVLVFKAFVFQVFFGFTAIFQNFFCYFNLFFVEIDPNKLVYVNFLLVSLFFFSLLKLYLVHFLFVWVNFFLSCLQVGWAVIFIFLFIGLIFIFLPYYIVSGAFVLNYLTWYFNSAGGSGHHLFNMESDLGISRVRKYGVYFQFSPDLLDDDLSQFEFLSGYFTANPDNNLRIVYYFVTSTFLVSFLFVLLVFLSLVFFFVPVVASFLFTKLIFFSFVNFFISTLFVVVVLLEFFCYNFFSFFFSFFFIFFSLVLVLVIFVFVKLYYNNIYGEVKDFFMKLCRQTTIFRVFFYNLIIFFVSYYIGVKIVVVEFFEVVEFLFFEDVEYVTPMRFHKHFPTILDW